MSRFDILADFDIKAPVFGNFFVINNLHVLDMLDMLHPTPSYN